MAQLVYSDNLVEAFFHEGKSTYIVVTFSEMGMKANGKDYWSKAAIEKLGLNCVGIVARTPNWFPRSALTGVHTAIASILARFDTRIGYGLSMGGYAAIKYSSLLRFDRVLAFSPQISIDPSQVGHFDSRFTHHFQPHIHHDMEIGLGDSHGDILVIVDPFDRLDYQHAKLIAHAVPSVLLKATYTGHASVRAIADSQTFTELMAITAGGGDAMVSSLKRLIRSSKKSRACYRTALISALVKRNHVTWADSLIRSSGNILNDSFQYHDLRRAILYRQGHFAEAVEAAREAVARNSGSWMHHIYVAEILVKLGDLTSAEEAARRAVVLNGHKPHVFYVLGTILKAQKRLDEAVAAIRQALELKKNDTGLQWYLNKLLSEHEAVE